MCAVKSRKKEYCIQQGYCCILQTQRVEYTYCSTVHNVPFYFSLYIFCFSRNKIKGGLFITPVLQETMSIRFRCLMLTNICINIKLNLEFQLIPIILLGYTYIKYNIWEY